MTEIQVVFFVLLWVVIFVEGILLFQLYRHLGKIYSNRMGLKIGDVAPSFLGISLDRGEIQSDNLLHEGYTFYIFGSFDCQFCRDILFDQKLKEFLEAHRIQSYFLINSSMKSKEDLGDTLKVSEVAFEIVLISEKVIEDYLINSTPFVYVINNNGIIMTRGSVTDQRDVKNMYKQVRTAELRTGKTSNNNRANEPLEKTV